MSVVYLYVWVGDLLADELRDPVPGLDVHLNLAVVEHDNANVAPIHGIKIYND